MSLKPGKPPTIMQSMGKKPIPLLLLILVVWIIGGSWWYHITCCSTAGLLIQDGTVTVAEAKDNIQFAKGDATPIYSSEVEASLRGVADYMKKNPTKYLSINGVSHKDEGSGQELGLSRAENVKKLLGSWGLNTDYIIAQYGGDASEVKTQSGNINGSIGFEMLPIPSRSLAFGVGGFNLNADDNLSFSRNSAKINEPIPEGLKASAKELATHLKANPDIKMNIIGWYGTTENAGTDDLNLGRARAEALRNWWISMGVPAGQVVVAGSEEKGDLVFVGDKLYGGAQYSFAGVSPDNGSSDANTDSENAGEGENLPDGYNTDGKEGASTDGEGNSEGGDGKDSNTEDVSNLKVPEIVNIYFDKNSDIPKIEAAEGDKLATYVKYLSAFKDKTLSIYGYASAEGSAAYNKALGGRRGEAVKNYLIAKEVSADQIKIIKIGAAQTTAKDDSEAERSKDRRAELKVD